MLLGQLAWAQAEPFVERGNQKMEARDFAGALIEYRAGLGLEPQNSSLLFNAGLAAYECQQFDLARTYWKQFHQLKPDDSRGFSKLIQAEQALGNEAAVKTLSAQLRQWASTTKDPRFAKDPFFVRHQFDSSGRHFMVFEHLHPDPNARDHFWDIVVQKPGLKGNEAMFYLMYDQAASQPDRPMWFLDLRNAAGRRPITSFDYQPGLNEVVELVKKSVAGEKTPIFKGKDGKTYDR